jgi:hypothetical protein
VGKAHAPGHVNVGKPPVGLQGGKDLAVEVIKLGHLQTLCTFVWTTHNIEKNLSILRISCNTFDIFSAI